MFNSIQILIKVEVDTTILPKLNYYFVSIEVKEQQRGYLRHHNLVSSISIKLTNVIIICTVFYFISVYSFIQPSVL